MADFRYFRNNELPADGLWHTSGITDKLATAPWEVYMPWFRIAPHVYQVSAQMSNGSYLIDTGEGLILVDAPSFNNLYLEFESIRMAGFDPHDIKYIWITHCHGDHFAGARAVHEYTGAPVCIGRECWEYYTQRIASGAKTPVSLFVPEVSRLIPDLFLDDLIPFEMGRFRFDISFHHGHCRGSLVFFFDDTDEETGKTYRVGMHGGIGECGMWNILYAGDPEWHYYRYIADSLEMAEWPVDITLYSHENQTNAHTGVNPEDPMDYSQFVDPKVWRNLLLEKAKDSIARPDPMNKGSNAWTDFMPDVKK